MFFTIFLFKGRECKDKEKWCEMENNIEKKCKEKNVTNTCQSSCGVCKKNRTGNFKIKVYIVYSKS